MTHFLKVHAENVPNVIYWVAFDESLLWLLAERNGKQQPAWRGWSFGAQFMTDFTPIDHKDSDPEYRAAVRAVVESILGSPLSDITDSSDLVGRWIHSFSQLQNLTPQAYRSAAPT